MIKAKITKQEFSDFSNTIIFFADLEQQDKQNTIHNFLELIQQKNDGGVNIEEIEQMDDRKIID